jgi:hypothetical protein
LFYKKLFKNSKITMQKTIPQLWKQNFKNSKNEDFLWDNILWKQTKKDFILKAYFIAGRIKKIKWDYVGIMMPVIGAQNYTSLR